MMKQTKKATALLLSLSMILAAMPAAGVSAADGTADAMTATITLNETAAEVTGSNVTVEGSKITISASGSYAFSGKLTDGQIIVNVADEAADPGTVKLFFNGVDIKGVTAPPVYVMNAENTSIDGLKASRYHRAYGGFSMGGGSTWNMMINNLDVCAYYMPLSGHCWAGATGIQNAIDKFGLKPNEYFVFAATGDKDIAYGNLSGLCNSLKADTQRFKYTSDFSKGNFYYLVASGKDHYWGNVRHYIYDALPSFFHEGQ